MDVESEHFVEQNSYTVEEIVGTILHLAIKLKYVDRDNLTAKAKILLSEAGKFEPGDDWH